MWREREMDISSCAAREDYRSEDFMVRRVLSIASTDFEHCDHPPTYHIHTSASLCPYRVHGESHNIHSSPHIPHELSLSAILYQSILDVARSSVRLRMEKNGDRGRVATFPFCQ